MSLIQKASDTLGSRILVVAGAKGTGKTTFAVTGSKFYKPGHSHTKPIECSDVVLVQNDTNGVLGAISRGLHPLVIDFSGIKDKLEWDALFDKAYTELYQGFQDKQFRILAIDLSGLDKLLRDVFVAKGEGTIKDWEKVTSHALKIYRQLRALPNVTIVAMTHLSVQAEVVVGRDEASKAASLARLQTSRDVIAIGGEKADVTVDLCKGHKTLWSYNADMQMAMKRTHSKIPGKPFNYSVLLNSDTIETGGRWHEFFAEKEQPAVLYPMLQTVYGDAA